MARKTRLDDPEQLRRQLIDLLTDFEQRLKQDNLREQVKSLIPAVYVLRDLGSSLVPGSSTSSARDRILTYLRRFPFTVIAGDELGVVSGISEYARRVRELRVQFGWPIYSGITAREMLSEEDSYQAMDVNDYILLGEQDRDAAHRWNVANTVRKLDLSVRDRILTYLRENEGKPVTGEELRYVAKGATEWGRRTRELRTEEGWPVATRSSGRPDLPVGTYILEADRQSLPHDRKIPDVVRVAVLERDDFSCQFCGWNPRQQSAGDPRSLLELHHVEHHVEKGSNALDNLVTLCNVHHDDIHRNYVKGRAAYDTWLASGKS